MTGGTDSLHLQTELETFALAMNNKHNCEGNWWWVISSDRKGYRPRKHKPVGRMCWDYSVWTLCMSTVTSWVPEEADEMVWSAVMEAAARSYVQNMFCACHSGDLSPPWCQVKWVFPCLVVTRFRPCAEPQIHKEQSKYHSFTHRPTFHFFRYNK